MICNKPTDIPQNWTLSKMMASLSGTLESCSFRGSSTPTLWKNLLTLSHTSTEVYSPTGELNLTPAQISRFGQKKTCET